MLYHLSESTIQQIESLFKDQGIDLYESIDDAEYFDINEIIKKCDNRLNYPLFLDRLDEYYKYEKPLSLIPEIQRRLKFLDDYIEGDTCKIFERPSFNDLPEINMEWSNGQKCSTLDLAIFSCAFPIFFWGEEVFTLDYEKYGFESWEDLVFSIGAHILNERECKYQEKINYWVTENNGKTYKNYFCRHLHGDFRFEQINVTQPKDLRSPFNDRVTFFKVDSSRRNGIFAYHSVETNFLLILKKYDEEIGLHSSIFKDYESYFNDFISKNKSCLGNFGDAGCNDDTFITFTMGDTIPNVGEDFRYNPFFIPKEYEGIESAFMDGDDLIFTPDPTGKNTNLDQCVRFSKNDIDHLIHHLHLQCTNGVGRSSVSNLRSAMTKYEKYKYQEKEIN